MEVIFATSEDFKKCNDRVNELRDYFGDREERLSKIIVELMGRVRALEKNSHEPVCIRSVVRDELRKQK